jgi:hypothetical protein
MTRAIALATTLAALATVGCASSTGNADNSSLSTVPYHAPLAEDFFAPLTTQAASQIWIMPRAESRFATVSFSARSPGNFISLGAGDALGIRVHIADRVIAHAPTSWDLTEVPTD